MTFLLFSRYGQQCYEMKGYKSNDEEENMGDEEDELDEAKNRFP